MIEKKLVERNFSRNVATYEKYADVQKNMAKKLIELCVLKRKPEKILEIGSGTGIFTELLIEKFPESEIDILDISESMLEVSKEKFGDKVSRYICADAENYITDMQYDLIISNASFQWFGDVNSALEKLKTLLNNEGEIYFSVFASETYKELRETFIQYDPEYIFSQNFISKSDLDNKNLNIEILDEEHIVQNFESLYDFLKAVKGIGANSALKNKKVLTKNMLKQIEKLYIKKYKKISVTNHLLYIKIKKTKS